jgi:hypothetical protein
MLKFSTRVKKGHKKCIDVSERSQGEEISRKMNHSFEEWFKNFCQQMKKITFSI